MAIFLALRKAAHIFSRLGLIIADIERLKFGGELNFDHAAWSGLHC
jgi:hypothetical protein